MDLTVSRLVVNSERLRASCTAELFATDRALELVSEGVAFRDAYQQVGRELEKLSPQDPAVAIEKRTSTGTPGNLRLDVPRMIASGYREAVEKEEYAKRAKISALAGREVELFPDPYKRGATEPVG
jgi:argininosuccinate lyase